MFPRLLRKLFSRKSLRGGSDDLRLSDPKIPEEIAGVWPSGQSAKVSVSLRPSRGLADVPSVAAECNKFLAVKNPEQRKLLEKQVEVEDSIARAPSSDDLMPEISPPDADIHTPSKAAGNTKSKLTKEERDARWERKIRIRDRRELRILGPVPAKTKSEKPKLTQKKRGAMPKLTKEERDARWERKIRIRDKREARILRENCISQSGLE